MIRSRQILLAVIWAVACGCSEKEKPPGPAATAPRGGAARAAAVASLTAFDKECLAANRRNMVAWNRPGEAPVPEGGVRAHCTAPSQYNACPAIDDGSGWLATVSDVALDSDGASCSFKWSVAYVDLAKNVRDALPAQKGSAGYGEVGIAQFTSAGQGAVFVETQYRTPSNVAVTANEGVVYVARDGKIARFQGFEHRNVAEVKDVDGDGLIDFIIESPFVAGHNKWASPGISILFTKSGPTPIAHRMADGTVSFDDAIASSLARKQCATRPSTTPPKIDKPDGEDGPVSEATVERFAELEEWIMCSRFWGTTPADIKKALRPCTSFVDTSALDIDEKANSKMRAGACPSHLNEWASVALPFVLK